MSNQPRLRRAKHTVINTIAVLLGLFTLLLLLTQVLPGHFADLALTQWVQQHHHPLLTWLAFAIGEIGKPHYVVIKALLPALLLIFFRLPREGFFLMATLLADIANLLLKQLIDRSRPAPHLIEVLKESGSLGFPSGHTVNFIVYFGFLMVLAQAIPGIAPMVRRVLTAFFFVLILLAPWARVYKGMHWPSDVIGGGFFGCLLLGLLCGAYFFAAKRQPRPHS